MLLKSRKTLWTYKTPKPKCFGTVDPKEATTDPKRDPRPTAKPLTLNPTDPKRDLNPTSKP